MNVRKRDLPAVTGQPPKNSVTTRKDGPTQAAPIRNAHNKPKPCGFTRVRNAVNPK